MRITAGKKLISTLGGGGLQVDIWAQLPYAKVLRRETPSVPAPLLVPCQPLLLQLLEAAAGVVLQVLKAVHGRTDLMVEPVVVVVEADLHRKLVGWVCSPGQSSQMQWEERRLWRRQQPLQSHQPA